MTTPITPVVPAAPVAPDPNASARDFFQVDDAALAQVWNVPTSMAGDTPPAEVEDSAPPQAPPVAPTDEVVVPPLERKPMTEFAVFDPAGEIEIPDLKIRFKAKGEARELPLDHVVRLAQFGYANEEREQQVLAARKFVAESETRESNYQTQIQQYESYYDKIFHDPSFYEEARLAYIQQNSPEARAQRAEAQLATQRQEKVQEQQQQVITRFVQEQLVPRVNALLTNHPTVTQDELIGRYTQLTAPFYVRGTIPLDRLQMVQRVVDQDLSDWVQHTHFERESQKQQASQQAAAAAGKATQEAAAVKRQAARVFAHAGSPAAEAAAPKPTKYNSAQDWLKSTFGTDDD